MCTGVRFSDNEGNMYFGRNLDWSFSYGETILVTPRGYRYRTRRARECSMRQHDAFAVLADARIDERHFAGVHQEERALPGGETLVLTGE